MEKIRENFPTPCNSSPGPFYCATDVEATRAGCPWGLIVAKHGNQIYVLTTIGVRYYGVPSECEILTPSDPRYTDVNRAWKHCIENIVLWRESLPETK